MMNAGEIGQNRMAQPYRRGYCINFAFRTDTYQSLTNPNVFFISARRHVADHHGRKRQCTL